MIIKHKPIVNKPNTMKILLNQTFQKEVRAAVFTEIPGRRDRIRGFGREDIRTVDEGGIPAEGGVPVQPGRRDDEGGRIHLRNSRHEGCFGRIARPGLVGPRRSVAIL